MLVGKERMEAEKLVWEISTLLGIDDPEKFFGINVGLRKPTSSNLVEHSFEMKAPDLGLLKEHLNKTFRHSNGHTYRIVGWMKGVGKAVGRDILCEDLNYATVHAHFHHSVIAKAMAEQSKPTSTQPPLSGLDIKDLLTETMTLSLLRRRRITPKLSWRKLKLQSSLVRTSKQPDVAPIYEYPPIKKLLDMFKKKDKKKPLKFQQRYNMPSFRQYRSFVWSHMKEYWPLWLLFGLFDGTCWFILIHFLYKHW